MRKVFKLYFKLMLFIVNLVIGVLVTIYLVVKFKTKRQKPTTQLSLIPDKAPKSGITEVISQSKRTEEVYKIIKDLKAVEMPVLLNKIKGVTERTLRRDLAKLQSMKLIKKVGSTKSAKYILNK